MATRSTLDTVILDIGVCGRFQVLLVAAVHSALVVCVWGMMMLAFGSYNPGWTCLDDLYNTSGGSSDGRHVLSADLTNDNSNSSSSTNPGLHNTTDLCVLYRACRNVSFSPGTSTLASEWGLVCHRAWILKLIFTVQMGGVFLGVYLSGHLGEWAGRKVSLYSMLALSGLTNLLAVFSPSWQVYATIRFFIGVSVGGIVLPCYVTPLEFTGRFWRGVIGSLPTWSVGTSVFAVFVYLLKDWRHLHIMGAVLSGLVFLPVFWVPESFRWLAVHGRDKHAKSVVTKIAKMNGRPKPSLELVVNMAAIERRRALTEGSDRYTYLDLFRDRFVRKIVVFMTFIWLAMSVVYFGISFGVQALSGDFYINFLILSVMEISCSIFSLPTMNFLTRRFGSALHLFIVSMACFGVTLVKLTMKNNHSLISDNIVLGLAVIAKIGIICAWNVITVYCNELFPTAVRNLGLGYLNAVARIGGFLGPVMFPQDPAKLYLAMLVLGALSILSTMVFLLLPETKFAPMEDTLPSRAVQLDQHDSQLENADNEDAIESCRK